MAKTFDYYIHEYKYSQDKDFISFIEFCGLGFKEGIPEFIQDLLYTLCSFNLQESQKFKTKQLQIRESSVLKSIIEKSVIDRVGTNFFY